jgi:hypothetical protein
MAVLKSAPDEYDDAVAKGPNAGRVVHPLGYQTARGFVREAGRLIDGVAAGLEVDDAAALADIRAHLSRLDASFTSVIAPRQTDLSEAAFEADVAQVVAAAGKFLARQTAPNLN